MNSVREDWRPVVGYEGFYSVSNCGRIRRDKAGRGAVAGKMLNQTFLGRKKNQRYYKVGLVKEGVQVTHLVHRLVALAFLGEPPTKEHNVNHIDGDKHNNVPGNLEYTTILENIRHAGSIGLSARGERNGHAKLTEVQVHQIRAYRRFDSYYAKLYNVSKTTIGDVRIFRTWRHVK